MHPGGHVFRNILIILTTFIEGPPKNILLKLFWNLTSGFWQEDRFKVFYQIWVWQPYEASLVGGNKDLSKRKSVMWTEWLPCPYLVKTMKKSSCQKPLVRFQNNFTGMFFRGPSIKIVKKKKISWITWLPGCIELWMCFHYIHVW